MDESNSEPRSSEAATSYYKDLREREIAVCRKRSREEVWREPQVFWVSIFILKPSCTGQENTQGPCNKRLRSLSLARVNFCNLHPKNFKINEISVCS